MSFFSTAADEGFDVARAEVGFILDLQLAIQAAMETKGLTQADLARLMGVSEARVSQMLSDSGANLRAQTIGAVGKAMGLTPCIRFEEAKAASNCISMTAWIRGGSERESWGRASVAANQDYWQHADALAVG